MQDNFNGYLVNKIFLWIGYIVTIVVASIGVDVLNSNDEGSIYFIENKSGALFLIFTFVITNFFVYFAYESVVYSPTETFMGFQFSTTDMDNEIESVIEDSDMSILQHLFPPSVHEVLLKHGTGSRA
jgi:hypothetical protein